MEVLHVTKNPSARYLKAVVIVRWPDGRTAHYAKWRKGGGWNNFYEGIDCASCLQRELNKVLKNSN
ncbi:MAG: hypothetical protein ACOYLQ_15370 [Hyphomicrobiaceae bacterium]